MQTEILLCRLQKAFRPPSAGSTKASYPNLTQHLVVERLNRVWVVDMTDIRLPQGFVYLTCVLDGFSRRVIGWHFSRDIDTCLTLAALNQAIATRRPRPGLIHHSDRGVQYASGEYVARLTEIGAMPSMSKACCPFHRRHWRQARHCGSSANAAHARATQVSLWGAAGGCTTSTAPHQ